MNNPSRPARARIEHSADGTLVHDTDRDDRHVAALLKQQGFRWSRKLVAWYLPRTWSEPTRADRITALEVALGPELVVNRSTSPGRSAAAREADRRSRAATRASRLDHRAQLAQANSDTAFEDFKSLSERIPLGQPILLGHHSQRRHERDLDKLDRLLARSGAEQARAEQARAGAARAKRVADGVESVATIGNRIDRTETELRKLRRRVDVAGFDQEYVHRQLAKLEDDLALDRAKLAAAGGVTYSKDNVRPGDLVKIRGRWYPVVRANAKTVSVPHAMMPVSSNTTSTSPWHEVQEHIPIADASAAQVRAIAETSSTAFPALRRRLEIVAESLCDPDPTR